MTHGGSLQSLTNVESRHSKRQTVKPSLQPRHLHLQLLSSRRCQPSSQPRQHFTNRAQGYDRNNNATWRKATCHRDFKDAWNQCAPSAQSRELRTAHFAIPFGRWRKENSIKSNSSVKSINGGDLITGFTEYGLRQEKKSKKKVNVAWRMSVACMNKQTGVNFDSRLTCN